MTTLEEWDKLIIRSKATTAFLQASRAEEKIKVLKESPFPNRGKIAEQEELVEEYKKLHRDLVEQVGMTPNI